MNIYVGNLDYKTTDDDLRELFEEFGAVDSASVIKDRDSGRSKGFGFVEMGNEDEALEAIDELDGAEIGGRTIKVNKARPKGSSGGDRRGGGRYKR